MKFSAVMSSVRPFFFPTGYSEDFIEFCFPDILYRNLHFVGEYRPRGLSESIERAQPLLVAATSHISAMWQLYTTGRSV